MCVNTLAPNRHNILLYIYVYTLPCANRPSPIRTMRDVYFVKYVCVVATSSSYS